MTQVDEATQASGVGTAHFAARNLVKEDTVRKRYCETGSYHGIRPKKLENRLLLWPDVTVERKTDPSTVKKNRRDQRNHEQRTEGKA